MLPVFLNQRASHVSEKMDDPHCDPSQLYNTYRQFRVINHLIAGWKRLYRYYIKPALQNGKPGRLLDIGFGAGDIPLCIDQWARSDGLRLELTAIDPDPRALAYVQTRNVPENVEFLTASVHDMLDSGQRFDIVMSNSVLHHIPVADLGAFLESTAGLSHNLVIHNDIIRSDLAFVAFAVMTKPFFHHSFISGDGLLSIRRSYTRAELQALIPPHWSLQSMFPYRHVLIRRT